MKRNKTNKTKRKKNEIIEKIKQNTSITRKQ